MRRDGPRNCEAMRKFRCGRRTVLMISSDAETASVGSVTELSSAAPLMRNRMLTAENQKHILVVDRDISTLESLRQPLSLAGFAVAAITDASRAAAEIAARPPSLLILEWNIEGLAPLELIEQVRVARRLQPIRLIILSELSGEHDIVSGLNMGADDYITKPFSLREAAARIQAVLRARCGDARHAALSFEQLILNTATNRVTAEGMPLNVRGAEYRLLEFLMSHPGKAFNRSQLLAQVWAGADEIDERTVDVNVQRLRKILAHPGYDACIQTVRGFGYRFIER
jgi:two-component system phosphate regulon response regulator PhoB